MRHFATKRPAYGPEKSAWDHAVQERGYDPSMLFFDGIGGCWVAVYPLRRAGGHSDLGDLHFTNTDIEAAKVLPPYLSGTLSQPGS